MSRLRRLLAALTHSGPGYNLPHQPRRGDDVEVWLKAQRDFSTSWSAWRELDRLLNRYRLHADTGTPLDQHVCDGGNCDDCRGVAQ